MKVLGVLGNLVRYSLSMVRLWNEGVPPFLCATLLCESFRRLEGGLATFRKHDGHSRKDGFFLTSLCACGKRES